MRDMPARELAPRELAPLERPLPPRPPAVTRPGEKEAPTVPRTEFKSAPPPPSPARPSTAPRAVARMSSPPPPLGRPSGSAQGSGALTISSSGNFPFTWYLQRVTAKVHERWAAPRESQEGQVAVIVFEITRDGRIARAGVEKTSGNAAYDLAALRAVSEASPFPPLPDEFTEPPLRVHLGIHFSKRG
jgi:protein TonB